MQRFELAYPTGDPETSTLLVEKFVPREVRVGQRYTYTIRVTNLSDAPIANVVIDDTGAGISVDPVPRSARDRDEPGRWTIPMLAAGASKTIEASAVASELGTRTSCLTVDYEPRMCSQIAVVNPQLRIEKRAPEIADVCDRPEVTYMVTNTGTGTARGVVIHEPLPEGLVTEDGRREVRIQIGDLPAGATEERTVALRPTRTGVFESSVVVRSQTDEVVSEPTAIRFVQPTLDVAISGPRSQYAGEPIEYRVTVTNDSSFPARDTEVQLHSSADLEDTERELGTLAPGQSRSFAVMVPAEGRQTQLTASARGACAPIATDQIATTVQRVPALRIGTVDTRDPVPVGETTTYVVTVTNQGDAPSQNLDVTVELPEGMRVIDVDGPVEARVSGDRLILGRLGMLPAGEQVEWHVHLRAETPGPKRFRTEVSSSTLDTPVPDEEPTSVIAIQ